MKILVISHMYPHPVKEMNGGFVHEQVKAMKNQGMEVVVLSPKAKSNRLLALFSKRWKTYSRIPDQRVLEGVQIYYPKKPTPPKKLFFRRAGHWYYRALEKTLNEVEKEFPFDVIHAHVAYPDGYAAARLARKWGKPLVITIHGQDFQQTLHMGEVFQRKLKAALEGATKVVTVSKKLERIGREFFPGGEEKWVTIENGFDVDKVVEDPGERENLKPLTLLSVGNLIKTKGNHLTINAFDHLLHSNHSDREKLNPCKHCRLVIVGEGPEEDALRAQVKRLNLEEKVTFIKKLTYGQVLEEMSRADIFVLPSYKEGFGVVYLEAMAHGMPVIACEKEGIDGVLRHGVEGYLVKPEDEEDLEMHLRSLIQNPGLRKKLGENGKARAKEFTWENNAKRHKSLYQEVMNLDPKEIQ